VVTSLTLKMNTIFQRAFRSSPYNKQTGSIKGLRVSTNHKLYCPHRVEFLLRKPSKYLTGEIETFSYFLCGQLTDAAP